MSKKHFEEFAIRIRLESSLEAKKAMANMVIEVATADNPRFDKNRFLVACGL